MFLDRLEYTDKENTPSGWSTAIGVIIIGVPASHFEGGLIAIIVGIVGGLLGNEIEYQYIYRFDGDRDSNTETHRNSNEEEDGIEDTFEELNIDDPEIDIPRNKRLYEDIVSIRHQLAHLSNLIQKHTKEYEELLDKAATKEGIEKEHSKVRAQSLFNKIKLYKSRFGVLSKKYILLTHLQAALESGRITESEIEKVASTLSEESDNWENILEGELSNTLESEELTQEMRSILDQYSEFHFTDLNIDEFDNGMSNPEDFET